MEVRTFHFNTKSSARSASVEQDTAFEFTTDTIFHFGKSLSHHMGKKTHIDSLDWLDKEGKKMFE